LTLIRHHLFVTPLLPCVDMLASPPYVFSPLFVTVHWYQVIADPSETHDLLVGGPHADPGARAVAALLRCRLEFYRNSSLVRRPHSTDERACDAAMARGGFWGPWL
jgi:hypothetical protein